MLPIEVQVPSFRFKNFDEEHDEILLVAEKGLIEEYKDTARLLKLA